MLEHEALLRLGSFCAVLAVLLGAETCAPRRARALRRRLRWPANLGVAALSTALVRAVLPVTAIALAALAQQRQLGLLHAWSGPAWLEGAVAFAALDLVIYLQHVLFHAVPGLWRLHRMHHADVELDATTGVRFHPLEIALSALIKCGAVLALGAPPAAVLAFEVALNAGALFSHANLRLGEPLERALRWIAVTPDMHRVHHSVHADESNSNYGFNLPWWDRWLGTYRAQPRDGHERMVIGLHEFRAAEEQRLWRMLAQPLRAAAGGAAERGGARDAS